MPADERRKRKKKLAVSDSSDTDSEEEERRPPTSRRNGKGKGKGKDKGKDKGKGKARAREEESGSSSDEDEVEELIDNSQAGLSIKRKGKGKEKAHPNGKANAVHNVDDSSEEEEEGDEDGESSTNSIWTRSDGTLHGSDSEEGLGKWTKQDQQTWQDSDDDPSGEYEVDIVIRWRWHSRRNFAQYRVKWVGYPDAFNLWLPYQNFDGDLVDNYWKDIEFAGQGSRPKRWKDGTEQGLDVATDDEDTERELKGEDQVRRKAARRRKRRDIRVDRVQMREAYARKYKREKAEKEALESKLSKLSEERRKRKREEEMAKAKESDPPKKKTIAIGNKVRPTPTAGPSRTTAPPTTTIANSHDTSTTAKADQADRDRLEVLKMYATKSDAVLKAERRKAKEAEVEAITGRPAAANFPPMGQPSKAASSSSSSSTIRPPTATSDRAVDDTGSSTATRGGIKARGSFRGAHKVVPKTRMLGTPSKWNPLELLGSDRAPPTATKGASGQMPSPVSTNDEGGKPDRSEDAVVSGGAQAQQETLLPPPLPPMPASTIAMPGPPPVPPFAATALFYQPPRPHPVARGAIRTGFDPRRALPLPLPSRPPPATSPPTAGQPPASTMGMSSASPAHDNAASPDHVPFSPRQQDGLLSPLIEHQHASRPPAEGAQALTPADRDRAQDAIRRWKVDDKTMARIGASYNFLPIPAGNASFKEKKSSLDRVIALARGGIPASLTAKHKEAHRRNLVWIADSTAPIGSLEREVLSLPNFAFLTYGSAGVQEIWPASQGSVVMYTFGALMHKLLEQCYEKGEAGAWQVEKATSVLVHPWQKVVLEQLINAGRIESFLSQVMAQQDNVGDKDFALVDTAAKVLDDFEEVPTELTNCSKGGEEAPDAGAMDVEQAMLALDREVAKTLHRLQHEWRVKKRLFVLIMAKTRLETREIRTSYTLM